jgi:hypothetical protein
VFFRRKGRVREDLLRTSTLLRMRTTDMFHQSSTFHLDQTMRMTVNDQEVSHHLPPSGLRRLAVRTWIWMTTSSWLCACCGDGRVLLLYRYPFGYDVNTIDAIFLWCVHTCSCFGIRKIVLDVRGWGNAGEKNHFQVILTRHSRRISACLGER